ncbi:hypothetical protein BDU57DRAFT_341693 [Ampelomyces quisqualis]|uniref:Uncharacterized protein n=1 Tax=Ampelomyces quisqualis TaxID=50730 RepID=A0A6A5QCB7_AMPQU|nr:hypothetical protein BDU57DRAFT_341693 [Ampelomyces quisqualis]
MHGIPLEILRLILSNLAQYECYERFPTLTRASKRGILSARVVWGSLRTQNPLRQLFVTALEDTPFVVSGPEDDRGWISGLDELSRSEYAYDMTSLSFCPMVFVDGQLRAEEWPENTLTVLSDAISVLPALKHLRYLTVPPAYVKDAWCNKPYCKTCAQHYPPKRTLRNASATPNRCLQPGSQAAVYFSRLQICLDYSQLESLSMPYCGNRAAFCSIPWSYMPIACPGFGASLRRVSINVMVCLAMQSVFDDWIYRCPNLEFLEIALCRPPEFELKHAHSQLFWNAGSWLTRALSSIRET